MKKTYIYIDNYRGFSEQIVPVESVNFLVGENSTGKSSFLDVVKILSSPAFWWFDPTFGKINNEWKHFQDLVSASSKTKKNFSIGAFQVSEDSVEECNGMLVTYINREGRPRPSRISILNKKKVRTICGELWASSGVSSYKSREVELFETDGVSVLGKIVQAHRRKDGWKTKKLDFDLRGVPIFIKFKDFLFDSGGVEDIVIPFPFGNRDKNLAPIRTKSRRTYDAPQTEFSPEGEHTPYLIRKLLGEKSKNKDFKDFLDFAGENSGLFSSLKVKNYGKSPTAPFELQVVLDNVALSIDNVGYGVSQSLPVMVEIFVQPRKTLFSIQQPEVHLHPKAQAMFGDVIADLARDKEKNFFIETHSDFLIDRFRLNVRRKGSLSSQLLFFERVDGINKITSLKISEKGGLPEDQPESYREFFLNESLEMLG